ncbi:DUF6348 family protein [Diaphorobacter aerolatus]|uniref:Uncharacterized protein n=1 Tax=Diaphorobacter aerolatus TaxID=1288495 RepID=A0A7H0GGV5_9BURK|nr:DUF6348 family protein [Diaphorobacter aerolatus]QNP47521.1 hypothetical protein H9K75_14830 [Diaphorobacter aerolatus]
MTSEDGQRLTLQNGLVLEPLLMAAEAKSPHAAHTSTVIEVSHATLFPHPIFEYQHASGTTREDALRDGFEQWADMDLVTLTDACRSTPDSCSVLELRYELGDDGFMRDRQVLLGPMTHYQEYASSESEDHAFCPCCLLTNSLDAFDSLLRSERFLAIRLYATRDGEGHCNADCRVNGQDFPAALPMLREYARTWPDAGMEFRKQYVVIRNSESKSALST